MYGCIFSVLSLVYTARADIVDCSDKVCLAVACPRNTRPVYVGNDCCESCITPLEYGRFCNPSIEPYPGDPTGPSGAPRVLTNFPICNVGLQCDMWSTTCV